MSDELRVLHLTDVHLQEDREKDVLDRLRRVVQRCTDRFDPHVCVVTGDLIQDADERTDEGHVNRVVSIVDELDAPVYYTAGNHDLANLDANEFERLVGSPPTAVHEVGEYAIVALNSAKPSLTTSGELTDDQLEFLRSALEAHDTCLLFVHHPPQYLPLEANPWFSTSPERALLRNKRAVNDLIDASESALAVFNGHVHQNFATVSRGVPRFTLNAFNKETRTSTEPTGSFAEVTVTESRITREVYDRRGFVRSDGRPRPR